LLGLCGTHVAFSALVGTTVETGPPLRNRLRAVAPGPDSATGVTLYAGVWG
jgi:hypothetical protein